MPSESDGELQVKNKDQVSSSPLPDDMEVGSEEHLDFVYDKYVKWRAAAPENRSPATAKQFSKKWKVTAQQIANFQTRSGFYDELEHNAKNWGRGKIPEMIHKLYHEVKNDPDPSDIERFIDIVTDQGEDDGDTFNTLNLLQLPDEQFKEIARREGQKLSDEKEVSHTISPEKSD
jgi:hypothetical protein